MSEEVMIPKKDLIQVIEHFHRYVLGTGPLLEEVVKRWPDPKPQLWWRRKWIDLSSHSRRDSLDWYPSKEDFNRSWPNVKAGGPWESRTFEDGEP